MIDTFTRFPIRGEQQSLRGHGAFVLATELCYFKYPILSAVIAVRAFNFDKDMSTLP
jgi:hypothetical protein